MATKEDFFPLGWLDRPFRRQPYPDMTYERALGVAEITLWNIGTDEAKTLGANLGRIALRMDVAHAQFEGRSTQSVAELNELWRGKVTTLLKWFQTSGGSK